MKPKIRLKISDVQIVHQEILSRNQEDLEKIKRQKREWYHRNKKKVLKQQKTSEKKKQYIKEWYLKNRQEKIQKSLQWTKENPEKRQLHIQKYVQKNSAETRFWKPYNIPTDAEMEWIVNFGQLPDFDPSKGKLSKRLTLKIADLKEQIAIADIKSNFSEAMPNVKLDAEYQISDDKTSKGSSSDKAEITATVNIPIFKGGKNISKIKQAKIIAKQVRYELESKKNEVTPVSYTHLTLPTILLV